MSTETLQQIYKHHKKIQNMSSISSLLGWDFETLMPKGSADLRSDQLSLINTTVFSLSTDPTYVERVMGLDANHLDSAEDKSHIAKLQKKIGTWMAVDEDFVRRETEAYVQCQKQWKLARESKSFAIVQDALKTMIDIRREQGKRLLEYPALKKFNTGKNAYEVLLDEYEPGISSEYLRKVLKALVTETVALLPEIEAKQKGMSPKPVAMDVEKQHEVVLAVAGALGFDFDHGRIDKSVHPFCSGHPLDTRMTTRYNAADVTDSLWSTVHETGHALYEQGLPHAMLDMPCGVAASMGVHESQSRFYENQIAKSLPFCEWIAPKLEISATSLFEILNHVSRTEVRTEADEVTYNMHIYLRFELEEQLVLGKLEVKDLENAWNESFKKLFGYYPKSPLTGVLQDTHWYSGLVGYFPTYSLGNLLAAELFEMYSKEFPNSDDLVRQGSFDHIKRFMGERVHKLAALDDSPGTMQKILGGRLPSEQTLIKHFRRKYLG